MAATHLPRPHPGDHRPWGLVYGSLGSRPRTDSGFLRGLVGASRDVGMCSSRVQGAPRTPADQLLTM